MNKEELQEGDIVIYKEYKACVAGFWTSGARDVVCIEFLGDGTGQHGVKLGWDGMNLYKRLYYPNYVSKHSNRFVNVYLDDSSLTIFEKTGKREGDRETYLFP